METPYLQALLERNQPVWIMGVHDVLSAKIAERTGLHIKALKRRLSHFERGQK